MKNAKTLIKKEGLNESDLTRDDIYILLKRSPVPTVEENKSKILNSIKKIIEDAGVLKDGINIDKLVDKIKADTVFSAYIKGD